MPRLLPCVVPQRRTRWLRWCLVEALAPVGCETASSQQALSFCPLGVTLVADVRQCGRCCRYRYRTQDLVLRDTSPPSPVPLRWNLNGHPHSHTPTIAAFAAKCTVPGHRRHGARSQSCPAHFPASWSLMQAGALHYPMISTFKLDGGLMPRYGKSTSLPIVSN